MGALVLPAQLLALLYQLEVLLVLVRFRCCVLLWVTVQAVLKLDYLLDVAVKFLGEALEALRQLFGDRESALLEEGVVFAFNEGEVVVGDEFLLGDELGAFVRFDNVIETRVELLSQVTFFVFILHELGVFLAISLLLFFLLVLLIVLLILQFAFFVFLVLILLFFEFLFLIELIPVHHR